ncbi:hypothetical protein F4802DRAFT_574368, partial [Xylaria palmicola]
MSKLEVRTHAYLFLLFFAAFLAVGGPRRLLARPCSQDGTDFAVDDEDLVLNSSDRFFLLMRIDAKRNNVCIVQGRERYLLASPTIMNI